MRPEAASRRLFAITRSKEKMFELGIPLESHLQVPPGFEPAALFPLTIGILGDAATAICNADDPIDRTDVSLNPQLDFCASYFDAFLGARFNERLSRDVTILASSAYYLAMRPGSSFVLAKRIGTSSQATWAERFLVCALTAQWTVGDEGVEDSLSEEVSAAIGIMAGFFLSGVGAEDANDALVRLRSLSLRVSSPRDLLFTEIAVSVTRMRLWCKPSGRGCRCRRDCSNGEVDSR